MKHTYKCTIAATLSAVILTGCGFVSTPQTTVPETTSAVIEELLTMPVQSTQPAVTVPAEPSMPSEPLQTEGATDPSVQEASELDLPETVLEDVAKQLLKAPDQVTEADLLQITYLYCKDQDLPDLSFLKYFQNLQTLIMTGNAITDISPVAQLSKLEELNLVWNQVADLRPLQNMISLKKLSLAGNQISNLAPISGLTNLTELRLGNNQISDLTPLADLTDLQILWLEANEISEVTPLSGLINLTQLWLFENHISDPSPLASLIHLEELMIGGNPIAEENRSVLDHLPHVFWDGYY